MARFVRVLVGVSARPDGGRILDPFSPKGPTRAQVRRLRRGLLAALLLACATHLLTSQWAGGASSFVFGPPSPEQETILVLHLRVSAESSGAEVTLGDVAFLEWKGAPIAGLAGLPISAIAELGAQAPTAGAEVVVGIEQIVAALEAAGVDPARIQVHGPVRCKVRLVGGAEAPPAVSSEAVTSDEAALMRWAGRSPRPQDDARMAPAATEAAPPRGNGAGSSPPQRPASAGAAAGNPVRPGESRAADREFIGTQGTVGEALRRDLAERLKLPVESIHLRFAGEDLPLAQRTGISAGDVRALSASDLGDVAWTVNVDGREIPLMAHASATLTRAVAVQGISAGQVVRAGDVVGQPGRIERIADRGVSPAQAAGQQAVRQLASGQVLREEDLKPRLLVQAGQLISVQEIRSGTSIRLLAKALDDGWHGQIVRAQREGSQEVIHVLVTSPQAGRVVEAPEGASASGSGDAIPGK